MFYNEWVRQVGVGLQLSVLILSTVLPTVVSGQTTALPPTWWTQGEFQIIDENVTEPNNYAVATVGQAKNVVLQALDALAVNNSLTAGKIRAALLGPPIIFDVSEPKPEGPDATWFEKQKAPLLVGQLKALAKPFYDKLDVRDSAWLANQRVDNETQDPNDTENIYPWNSAVGEEQNMAVANIGQLKAVFSLRFEDLPAPDSNTVPGYTADSDGDGIPDWWEYLVINAYSGDSWSGISQINLDNAVSAGQQTGVGAPPLPSVSEIGIYSQMRDQQTLTYSPGNASQYWSTKTWSIDDNGLVGESESGLRAGQSIYPLPSWLDTTNLVPESIKDHFDGGSLEAGSYTTQTITTIGTGVSTSKLFYDSESRFRLERTEQSPESVTMSFLLIRENYQTTNGPKLGSGLLGLSPTDSWEFESIEVKTLTIPSEETKSDWLEISTEPFGDLDPSTDGSGGTVVRLLPVEITVAFGEGPDIPDGQGDKNSRELLEEYLDGIKVARQGDVWAVNGKDAQGNDKIWGVEIVSDQAKLNGALSSGGRYVVFDGHSNFGLGPDFGGINITKIADLTNYGVKYTDVPLNFRLRGPVNDPTKWGDPFIHMQVGDNEIPAAPTNYKPLPINEERFPNIDGVVVGQAFQKLGQGFDTWHYRIQGGSKRLMIDAPKTDLPGNLAYKTFFYNACNTGVDYIENFKQGDFIYTNDSCFVLQGTQIYVQGVVEGKTTGQIMPLLNQLGVGNNNPNDTIYEFKSF